VCYTIEKGGGIVKRRLAVTVEDELLERLVELAKQENRTLSNYVETLLYKALEKEEK
jgi:predicted DNA-binding protein